MPSHSKIEIVSDDAAGREIGPCGISLAPGREHVAISALYVAGIQKNHSSSIRVHQERRRPALMATSNCPCVHPSPIVSGFPSPSSRWSRYPRTRALERRFCEVRWEEGSFDKCSGADERHCVISFMLSPRPARYLNSRFVRADEDEHVVHLRRREILLQSWHSASH